MKVMLKNNVVCLNKAGKSISVVIPSLILASFVFSSDTKLQTEVTVGSKTDYGDTF
jgi:hypothetical protein